MKYYAGEAHRQTAAEELANTVTHGVGLLASITAMVLLIVVASLHGGALRIVSLSIFGASLVVLYLVSTLYHMVRSARAKRVLQMCDHGSIYLLIAGTYTPFMLVALGGGWGWSLFAVQWGLAAVGICFKLFCARRLEWLSLMIYIAMGWMAVICVHQLIAATSSVGLAWLIAGGLAYTGGVIFYLWDHLPFNHAIWHVFVLGGSACHVLAAYQDVL